MAADGIWCKLPENCFGSVSCALTDSSREAEPRVVIFCMYALVETFLGNGSASLQERTSYHIQELDVLEQQV